MALSKKNMPKTRTSAQRLNARYDKIWDTYKKQEAAKWNLLPTCMEYAYFLDEAVKRLKITIEEARSKYGLYTYGQWKTLMGLA
jgi:hypothetical protein